MGGKTSKTQENRKTSVSEVKKNPSNLNTPKRAQDSQQKTPNPPVLLLQNNGGGSKQPTNQKPANVPDVKVAAVQAKVAEGVNKNGAIPSDQGQAARKQGQPARDQGQRGREQGQITRDVRAEEVRLLLRQLKADFSNDSRIWEESLNSRRAARNTTPPPSRRRDYFVPQPLTKEAKLVSQSSYDISQNRLHGAALERFKTNWYIQELNIVPNEEEFECPICCLEIDSCAGVQLHECLHCVCRDCLEHHIMGRNTSAVPCPCDNCQQFLLEREIKTLLTEEQFTKFQAQCSRELQGVVISKLKCKMEGCNWWAELEKSKNSPQFIECQRCQSIICVNCDANHENLTCEEYKQKLKNDESRALTDQIIQICLVKLYYPRLRGVMETKQLCVLMQVGIDKGEMMRCPGCGIPVTKIAGCDWIQCSECRTEMCWATKQRRWGPKGHGDTSEGCKCGSAELNYKKCHPNCGNCH